MWSHNPSDPPGYGPPGGHRFFRPSAPNQWSADPAPYEQYSPQYPHAPPSHRSPGFAPQSYRSPSLWQPPLPLNAPPAPPWQPPMPAFAPPAPPPHPPPPPLPPRPSTPAFRLGARSSILSGTGEWSPAPAPAPPVTSSSSGDRPPWFALHVAGCEWPTLVDACERACGAALEAGEVLMPSREGTDGGLICVLRCASEACPFGLDCLRDPTDPLSRVRIRFGVGEREKHAASCVKLVA